MTNHSPILAYTYKITCIPTGQFYFGYRYKNIKDGRQPEDDLLIHYDTSSELVKSLIKQYGVDSFEKVILDRSSDPDCMIRAEQQYIKDNWGNELLLNKHYVDPESKATFRVTAESIAKGLQTKKERGTDITGVQKTVQTKTERGIHKIAGIKGVETKRKRGTDTNHAKIWELTYLDNPPIIIKNLRKFCQENGLNRNPMSAYIKTGKRHKGWKCKQVVRL